MIEHIGVQQDDTDWNGPGWDEGQSHCYGPYPDKTTAEAKELEYAREFLG
jgi:hypothetical protein